MRAAFAQIAAVCALSACATSPGPRAPEAVAPRPALAELRAATILPAAFSQQLADPKDGARLRVPAALLRVSTIARPRADVRSGPGTQFDLEDFVLPQGAPVLVFDRVGVWQKVVSLGLKKRGWVHYQTLGPIKPTARSVTIDESLLPTTLAAHATFVAAAYPAKDSVAVAIPKGAMFRALAFDGGEALVVVSATNSVMWVSRKDMR